MVTPLDVVELSVRTTNVLKNAGIGTLEELAAMDIKQLRTLPNCGARTIKEIQELMKTYRVRAFNIPPTLLQWVAEHEGLVWQLATGKAVIVPLHRLVSVNLPNSDPTE